MFSYVLRLGLNAAWYSEKKDLDSRNFKKRLDKRLNLVNRGKRGRDEKGILIGNALFHYI